MVYVDASLLVKLYVAEAGSNQAEALLAPPATTGTALISRAEVAAALAKSVRVGTLTREEGARALGHFRGQWPQFIRLRLNEGLVARADELAWDLNLRGYDAVHLAAALIWQEALDEHLTMATYDRQLWQAAQNQGLAAWP